MRNRSRKTVENTQQKRKEVETEIKKFDLKKTEIGNRKQNTVSILSLSFAGRPFEAFLGVQFGAPPVGDLRWEKPMAPSSWEGVRNATEVSFNYFPSRSPSFVRNQDRTCIH